MTNLSLNEANFWLGLEKKKTLDLQQNPYFSPHTVSRLTACFQMISDAPFGFQNRVFVSGCVTERLNTGSRFFYPLHFVKFRLGDLHKLLEKKKKKEKERGKNAGLENLGI